MLGYDTVRSPRRGDAGGEWDYLRALPDRTKRQLRGGRFLTAYGLEPDIAGDLIAEQVPGVATTCDAMEWYVTTCRQVLADRARRRKTRRPAGNGKFLTVPDAHSSAGVRAELAIQGRPVILAMSRGKDSLAAWVSLLAAGVEVIPVHLYLIPDLEFVAQSIAELESYFDTKIYELPHPSIWRWLTEYVYMPPERCGVIDATRVIAPDYPEIWAEFRTAHGLPDDTWVATGVRAADSPMRRIAMQSYGPWRAGKGEVHVVWDWKIADVRRAIGDVPLPVDYEWFGRSFDGLDHRFLGPLRDHAPADYARVLEWFPLAELAIHRYEMEQRYG